MPAPPRWRPSARLGSGVTPPASRDAEENALLDMRVLGQSSRPHARVAGPARGHTPKHHTGDARPTRARGHARPSPARACPGALDEDHVSNALVSLSLGSDGVASQGEEKSSKSSFPFRNDAAPGARDTTSDVSQRVSSLRVAERSIARASSLAKLVDEKRDAGSRSSKRDASLETEDSSATSVRVDELRELTFCHRLDERKVCHDPNADNEASPEASPDAGSTKSSDETDLTSASKKWSSVKRLVGMHAVFLEPRSEEKNSSRDRTWDALVLSGMDELKLAELHGGQLNADTFLRRSKTSPFAASARRENARHTDRGRVVTRGEFTDHKKKRLLLNAQRASPYWRACRSDAELLTFAEAFEFVRYTRGEHIVRAGDVADFALLVVQGEARLDEKRELRDPRGNPPRAEDKKKTAFGPGTVLGEMALFLGGFRVANVVACGSEKEECGSLETESKSDDDVESDERNREKPDKRKEEAAPTDAVRLAKKTRKETETLHTYAVRVYFDAFVDFFAAHPVLATRAFGAFTNAAACRLDQWRLASLSAPSPEVSGSASGGGGLDDVARRRDAREKQKRLREGLRGVSFARAWSEEDRAAVARVARVVEAKPGKLVFPAGASASDFGVLLAGSSFCSDEDGEDARMKFLAPDRSRTNRESSAGSVVGAVAFAAALFRPAGRPNAVVAGAKGASVAVFDAAALNTLDEKRPGLGLDLALAVSSAASAPQRPSRSSANDGLNDEDEEDEDALHAEEGVPPPDLFLPNSPEVEVCFPPDAQPPLPRKKKRNRLSRFAEKQTRELGLLRISTSSSGCLDEEPKVSDEFKPMFVSDRRYRARREIVSALRAAFSAAGATEASDLFRVSKRELDFLAASCFTLRFETGQQILRPGDRAAFAGVLVSGAASVVDAEGRVSASLSAGSVIGESGTIGAAEPYVHTYRCDAVIGGEDDTVVAVWTPEALRAAVYASDGATQATQATQANASEDCLAAPATAALAARAARMFVFLCASTAARRAAANAARARPRESFVSTLEFDSDGEEASYASDASSSASDAPRCSSAPPGARSVKARGDQAHDSGSPNSGDSENVRRLRATLWEWRDALADGAGASDVDALADAMLDGSHEKTLLVSFAPGERVMAAGTVSSATLLVIGGAVDVNAGARNETKEEKKKMTREPPRGPGCFAGERAYFERYAPGAEDVFVCDTLDAPSLAVRPRDAFADEQLGCSVIVFEHDALDRLRLRAPGLALAMFSRMAANAVV